MPKYKDGMKNDAPRPAVRKEERRMGVHDGVRTPYSSHDGKHAYAHESDGETPTGRKAVSKI